MRMRSKKNKMRRKIKKKTTNSSGKESNINKR